jgi:group I intron endonuclease
MRFHQGSSQYTLTHIPSGRFYIGSTRNLHRRIVDHRYKLDSGTHYNSKLQRVYTNWNDIEISHSYCETPDEAVSKEQSMLDRYSEDPLCCNIHFKASKGPEYSAESRAKLSTIQTGRVISQETRDRQSVVRTGRTIVYTEEGLKNLKQKLSNRVFSDEHKAKISAAKKGVPKSEEDRIRLRQMGQRTSRPVSINGVVYNSVLGASNEVKVDQATVRRRALSTSEQYVNWFYID